MLHKRISNMEVKRINRNQVFRYVNKYEKVSKPDIAANLGISIPTVLQNVNELIEQGMVREIGAFESTGGRKAKMIAPIHDSKYAMGVDITQNHIGFVLTDLSGTVLKHMRIYKPYSNNADYYRELSETIESLKNEKKIDDGKFLGCGISVPGIVDHQSKTIVFSHALGIANVSCAIFNQYIPYPCLFINDANAAGTAEAYDSDKYNAVYLSLSNSVGGAVICRTSTHTGDSMVGNQFYVGDNWRSGEFGHMILIPNGRKCYCGKKGCFDSYCNAKDLAKYTDGKLEDFFEELCNENKQLIDVWEEYLTYLSIQVNNLRMSFDCTVIIGGYVGSYIEPHIEYLRQKAAKLNTFEPSGSYIEPCKYRIEASALGAALMHIESFISKI